MKKTAIVTGGSGGLGSAICHELANKGYSLRLTYHSSLEKANATLDALPGDGHKAYRLNITDSNEIQTLAQQIQTQDKGLDLLVNCAGSTEFVAHENLEGLTDELFDRLFQVNVRATFAMVRSFTPLLKKTQGCIVNITSIAAKTAMGSNIAYCASKAAVENMTLSLARALAPDVRVLSVAPGLVDTEFVKGLDAQWRDRQQELTPLARLANPQEVAKAVGVAATMLTFSTGTSLAVDGGRTLAI